MRTAAEHIGNLNRNTSYETTGVTFHSMSDVTSSNNFIYLSNSHKISPDERNSNINLSYSFTN